MKRLNLNKLIINLTATVFAVAVLAATGITLGHRFSAMLETEPEPDLKQLRRLIKSWQTSLDKGDRKRALLLAERIADPYCATMPELSYLKLFRQFGLNSTALTTPFGEIDYLRWRDAAELRRLADRIVNSGDVALQELFAVVCAEIRPEREPTPTLTIMEIWQRKSGGPEDRLRMLGGLAAYFGYRMTPVYLVDAAGHPYFILAEFEKNGITTVADPTFGKLYPHTVVERMTAPAAWPSELREALARPPVYFIPAELADYRNVASGFYLRLLLSKNKNMPVFPVIDPMETLRTLMHSRNLPSRRVFFWTYPLAGAVRSARLPVAWRVVPPRANANSTNPGTAKKP